MQFTSSQYISSTNTYHSKLIARHKGQCGREITLHAYLYSPINRRCAACRTRQGPRLWERTLHELLVLLLRAGRVRAGRAPEAGRLEHAHAIALHRVLARVLIAVPATPACSPHGPEALSFTMRVCFLVYMRACYQPLNPAHAGLQKGTMASLRGLGMGAASRQMLLLHYLMHQSLSQRHAGSKRAWRHTGEG